MRIKNIKDVEVFLNVVKQCKGDVTLTSQYGDKFNLKSALSQYVAVAALLGDHGDELELWCTDKSDETKFLEMFKENPAMVQKEIKMKRVIGIILNAICFAGIQMISNINIEDPKYWAILGLDIVVMVNSALTIGDR